MKNRRELSRKILAVLPEKLRFALMRKRVRLKPEWPSESLEIKIATTEDELASAYGLLHDSYVKSGFMNPDPTGMRVLPQHLLPQTTTIVAKWDGKVIGTLSLIRDNQFGLPMEKAFDIGDRRYSGRRLAEVSSLAVDPAYRGQINSALFPMFRFVYQYARHCFGIHEFVIAVNPSMVDLYLGFMCFERLKAQKKAYDFVKGAPAVGLYLNFETAIERWKKVFAHRSDSSNFLKYWTEIPTDIRNQMPKRAYHSSSDPILTPKLLTDFFLTKARLASRLTFKEIQTLLDVYPFPGFRKALLPLQSEVSRKHVRIETQMRAELEFNKSSAEVLNVSMHGLLLRTSSTTLTHGQVLDMTVWLNESSFTRINAVVRWCPQNGLFGLGIINPSKEWLSMVHTLEHEYRKFSDVSKAVA
ncbi:MAG: GNAT family N-acetyltransferase [Pseudobdellovibrionaceae bacterium]